MATTACRPRDEPVGKRFLAVAAGGGGRHQAVREMGWRAGVVRAATHRDASDRDLQLLVEYDDMEWHRREWISVYKDDLFHLFFVEQSLVWTDRRDPFSHAHGMVMWPALTFTPLVSNVEIPGNHQPVEFLLDRELAFKDYKTLRPYTEWDCADGAARLHPEVRLAVRRWRELQDGQRILLTTPSVLLGYRVEVYRAEGTTQWYTAVIIGYNEATRELTVTDDTVLEEHNEDPALVQMRLIGDGVVESIMRGENVGITPRRSRSSALVHQQTSQLLQNRVIRGLSSVTCNTPANVRRPRQGRSAISEAGNSPEPPDKGSVKTRKRKTSETETSSTKTRFASTKEDLENKQSRRKNLAGRTGGKKKVLEEANNSKLREVTVIVEDCLQSSALLKPEEEVQDIGEQEQRQVKEEEEEELEEDGGSSVKSGEEGKSGEDECSSRICMPVEVVNSQVVEQDRDENCVIVAGGEATAVSEAGTDIIGQGNNTKGDLDCTIRVGEDDGPLPSRSPYGSSGGGRMDGGADTPVSHLLQQRFPDDRSDSGVSSLRSGSGDERSGSRSSALSSSDEPNNPAPSGTGGGGGGRPAISRSPLFSTAGAGTTTAAAPAPVWRDPTLLHAAAAAAAAQHRQLPLMAQAQQPPQTAVSSVSVAPTQHAPSPSVSTGHSAAALAAAALYPGSAAAQAQPTPALMAAHQALAAHHPHLYHPSHLSDLWKRGYAAVPPHLLAAQQPGVHEDLLATAAMLQDRDRHERMMRERLTQDLEKHQKEKERAERERAEREKMEREREREKQEREREEKERQEQAQALHNHFEKSLRQAAQQKRDAWNPIGGRGLPQPRPSVDDERKRAELEQQRRAYYVQKPPAKAEYPPPPAHTRNKMAEKMPTGYATAIPKSELNAYGYPVCQPQGVFFEPKKADKEPKREPLEVKNSVIVKHDTRQQVHNAPKPVAHYMSAAPSKQAAGMPYEYHHRSPTQSPHHLAQHHPNEAPKAVPMHHRAPASGGQLPSPHHQRRSPHHPHAQQQQQQQHPSPSYRVQTDGQAMIFAAGKPGYPFMSAATTAAAYQQVSAPVNTKPKVSSPAPPHVYGKPTDRLGGMAAVSQVPSQHQQPRAAARTPPDRPAQSKPQITAAVSPSPYQQVSQYHPMVMSQSPAVSVMSCPPPAHTKQPTGAARPDAYDRMYAGGVGKPPTHHPQLHQQQPHGASPPRGHPSAYPVAQQQQVQTQPLDFCVGPNKTEAASPKRKGAPAVGSPVCLEMKKRRVEVAACGGPAQAVPYYPANGQPPPPAAQPLLARVSEPSPLIAGAATTITTVVNAAAYRTPTPTYNVPRSPSSLTENLPDLSVTAVTIDGGRGTGSSTPIPTVRPPSVESTHSNAGTPLTQPISSPLPMATSSTPTPPASITPAPPVDEPPGTPAKTATPTPSVVDSEKSNSPGPAKAAAATPSPSGQNWPPNNAGSCYPVRHLKKAWLQRHTGEDAEDTTGVVGSGSCVTLPINIERPRTPSTAAAPKENPVNSIHSVGSMAVNSINKSKHFQNKAANRKAAREPVNGHPSENSGKPAPAPADDSSSSDQERGGAAGGGGRKSPPKRKPPKVKRKKGAAGPVPKKGRDAVDDKKRKNDKAGTPPSESGSDSDKESGSEKDSDSGASTAPASGGGTKRVSGGGREQPRKRGRRPKQGGGGGREAAGGGGGAPSKNGGGGDEPRAKKSRDEPPPPPQRDPFRKPPVGQLKKTGESFLQDGPCFEVAPKLAKCRECRWTPNQRSKNMPNIFCRFYAFRRLRYTKNGQLAIAGFSDPHKDALEDDLKLWLPNADRPPADLDLETSRFLLKQVGDHFCDLLVQEREAGVEHMSDDGTVAWKRVVQGVREMCDVCETTLFNCHWACGKCGFVICLDCYKSRKSGTIKVWGEPGKDRDEFSWLLCTNRQPHEQEKLMLTQIIAGDSLAKLGKMVHEMRELWNIEQFCGCPTSKEKHPNNANKEVIKNILNEKLNGLKKEVKEEEKTVNGAKEKASPLSWLADVALSNSEEKKPDGSSSEEEGNFSTLRELLIRPSKPNGSRATSPVAKTDKKKPAPKVENLEDVISNVIEESVPMKQEKEEEKVELKHYVRRYNWLHKGRQQLPIRIMTLTESKLMYPDVPHSWLCDGKLLRLSDPTCKDNYKIFQDQWKRGQPVIVSDVTRNVDKDLWHPDAFARDFGDEKNDLINCMTGNLVPNQPMRKFWEGFDNFSKRLRDDKGQPMLLKLKDWPPGEDFAEMLPTRYADLMGVLPLAEYTHRTGRLNLASRLPDCFVRPDLGPKMYNAYGSALHPNKGTTNLHLDISDAVNVMVYVGIPRDGEPEEHVKEAFRAIDEAGCDILTRRRVRDKGELPGALWHIYNARDADKIRDLLNKVVVEKGGRLEPHHDPIHDQSCYLDGPLRERLYKEYGVEGYAIVQCLGDAVFIPAGAPHQVRNLHNCIKVAEDFVSPENVAHCFHLTQEFRDLSDTHSNHEDKLQIKNIIYHAVKDSLSSLTSVMSKYVKKEEDRNGKDDDSDKNSKDSDSG